MVALVETYAPKNKTNAKNRVGNFFLENSKRTRQKSLQVSDCVGETKLIYKTSRWAPPLSQNGELRAAHEEAGKILAEIDDTEHEYSILIRKGEDGKYNLSEPIMGEKANVGDEVMKLVMKDSTIHGIAHLHHSRGLLSPGDFIGSLQAGITISAWTVNLEGELFLPSVGRWTGWSDGRREQVYAASDWAKRQTADKHFMKGSYERRFYNRPSSAEKYFHKGTRWTYRALR